MYRVAVLISGSGSNLQALIDSPARNTSYSIDYVISDRPGVYGLKRAELNGIKNYVVDRKVYKAALSDEILKLIKDKVDIIVLAGFLSILRGEILVAFTNKIINIHPSLIPSFCGSGMYGIKVHESVIQCGAKVSGCTVHFVDAGTDSGPIILQKTVPVYFEDDSLSLQKRVLEQEHIALPKALDLLCKDRLKIIDGRVKIID
ncbi:phosphoribosylglycinamide formyltransferase [Clostridium thermarum]|uniref:phosphoribosylglycinamide formyltransferase n=1 Tax=Clostridium thermarum TaxID=1716543 RepID=UPI0013D22063|nr:phosphoribosylglycinamide formyltransferase [Clostridium thermarum]